MVPCQLPIPNSCPLWPLPNLVLLRPVCLLPSPPTEHHSLNFVLPACPESAHSNCHTSGMVDATFFPSSSHLLQSSRVKLPIRVRGCGSCRTTDLMEGRRSRNHATPPPPPPAPCPGRTIFHSCKENSECHTMQLATSDMTNDYLQASELEIFIETIQSGWGDSFHYSNCVAGFRRTELFFFRCVQVLVEACYDSMAMLVLQDFPDSLC